MKGSKVSRNTPYTNLRIGDKTDFFIFNSYNEKIHNININKLYYNIDIHGENIFKRKLHITKRNQMH